MSEGGKNKIHCFSSRSRYIAMSARGNGHYNSGRPYPLSVQFKYIIDRGMLELRFCSDHRCKLSGAESSVSTSQQNKQILASKKARKNRKSKYSLPLRTVNNEKLTFAQLVTFFPVLHGIRGLVESSWNVMAHGDAWEEKWKGKWRLEWVASTLHIISEHGASSITTADAHTSAASSRLNRRPPADLNGLVRFAERRNLVSARVPSHFICPLPHSQVAITGSYAESLASSTVLMNTFEYYPVAYV